MVKNGGFGSLVLVVAAHQRYRAKMEGEHGRA